MKKVQKSKTFKYLSGVADSYLDRTDKIFVSGMVSMAARLRAITPTQKTDLLRKVCGNMIVEDLIYRTPDDQE